MAARGVPQNLLVLLLLLLLFSQQLLGHSPLVVLLLLLVLLLSLNNPEHQRYGARGFSSVARLSFCWWSCRSLSQQ